jgi:hypothetical protein
MGIRVREGQAERFGLYHPAVGQAIAEPRIPPKSCVTPVEAQISHCAIIWLDFSIALCDLWAVKEIEFTSAAVRQWRKLTGTTRAQIDLKLKAFAETGVGDVKALKALPECGCAPATGASCSR